MTKVLPTTAVAAVAIVALWATLGRERAEDDDEDEEEAQPAAAVVATARVSDDSARVIALAQVPGGRITDGGHRS